MKTDPFTLFDKDWALLSAGSPGHHNAMTISWGMMGTLWNLPVVEVVVRPQRYTYQFMETSDWFAVSFFPESCKNALTLYGTRSGRDCDKAALTGLHPEPAGQTVTFQEARLVLLCKKLYWQDLDSRNMPDWIKDKNYPQNDFHRAYIGQVMEIIER